MEVREARMGDELTTGLALIAPGGKHLMLRWNGSRYVALLNEGPPVHHQRPAVDVLFDSVVKAGGAKSCAAALLTGMGRDGADGLLRLRQNGAFTIAQSEATCVVFGMPREAINIGAVQETLDLAAIGPELTRQGRRIASGAPATEPLTI
jgi:two-component system, chemotaxis family, protein-glutamate methylesterase/glutaminase